MFILIMKKMTMMMFFISFIYVLISKTPIIMGMTVIFQAIIMSFMLIYKYNNSWFSLIMILIYMGGILMLFCYIISLCHFKTAMTKKMNLMFSLFLSLFITDKSKENLKSYKIITSDMLMPIYSNSMILSIFMMVVLLVIMMMTIFLTESSKGYLRSKY
uniref:NADH dehydrogenase subunit 6 n=1 Tax=Bregmatothrips sinensis TaxID=3045418 RepID=UPI0030E3D853